MEIDDAAVLRWLDPVASVRGDVAEVFMETRRRTVLEFRDAQPGEPRVSIEAGVSARLRRSGRERIAFVSGSGEDAVRDALKGLQPSEIGRAHV